jgi:hypothetical protein
MSATVGAIEFDGSPDPGSSTLEFSMDIGTNVISIIADEPLETVDFDAGFTDTGESYAPEAKISTEPQITPAQALERLLQDADAVDALYPPFVKRTI